MGWHGIENIAELHGAMTITAREKSLRRFRTDPDCRVLLMSTVGITGLNLAVANILCVFVRSERLYYEDRADGIYKQDRLWSWVDMIQLIGRLWRYPQKKEVLVYHFLAKNTTDDIILELSTDKLKMLHSFFSANPVIRHISAPGFYYSGCSTLMAVAICYVAKSIEKEEQDLERDEEMADDEEDVGSNVAATPAGRSRPKRGRKEAISTLKSQEAEGAMETLRKDVDARPAVNLTNADAETETRANNPIVDGSQECPEDDVGALVTLDETLGSGPDIAAAAGELGEAALCNQSSPLSPPLLLCPEKRRCPESPEGASTSASIREPKRLRNEDTIQDALCARALPSTANGPSFINWIADLDELDTIPRPLRPITPPPSMFLQHCLSGKVNDGAQFQCLILCVRDSARLWDPSAHCLECRLSHGCR